MQNTSKQYDTVIEECRSLFIKKMSDYGSAWRILRLPSLTDQIFIKAQKKKYFADAEVVNTKKITESTNLIQDFYLNPIPQDDIEIEGIEYDFDSDKLRPASMEILDRLFDFLELNQNLVVEINSHTDCRGSDTYNQKLSARRAKSCVDYLLSKGVPKDRLTSKGYGESEPNFLKDKDKQAVLDDEGNRILLTESYINLSLIHI